MQMAPQWGADGDTAEELRRNNILQRAILHYIGQVRALLASQEVSKHGCRETLRHLAPSSGPLVPRLDHASRTPPPPPSRAFTRQCGSFFSFRAGLIQC